MKPKHQGGYSERHTELCERVLVTLLRGLGPWKKSVYLIGGLVPRYLVDDPHVGTSDVDLVLDLQLVAEIEAYRTLEQNLKNLGFERGTNEEGQRQHHSWQLVVDETVTITVDLLCPEWEEAGRLKSVPGNRALSALRIPGAHLVMKDYQEVTLEAELLDARGVAKETVRVAGYLSFVVLKALAYEDRMEEKDAYDLIFILLRAEGGPEACGRVLAQRRQEWPDEPQLEKALKILRERFVSPRHDGPTSYARFQVELGEPQQTARLRQEAYTVVTDFLRGVDTAEPTA